MVPVGNNQSLSGTGSDVAVKKQRIESTAPGLNGSVPTTQVQVGNQESISGTGSDLGSAVQSGGTKKVSGTGSAVQAVGTKRVPASPLNPEQEEFLQDVYPTLTTEQIQNKALYQKAWDDFLEAKEDARREDEWGEEREKLAEKEKDKVLFKVACPSKLWTDDVLRNRAWVNWQADKRLGAERKVDQMFRSEEDRQYRVEDPIPASCMTDMMLKRHQTNRDGHRWLLMDARGLGVGMRRERAVRTGLRTTAINRHEVVGHFWR